MLENSVVPKDFDILTSQISLNLNNNNYNFDGGFTSYETLNKKNNANTSMFYLTIIIPLLFFKQN